MNTKVFLLFISLLFLPQEKVNKAIYDQEDILRRLVFLRTEELYMIEILEQYTTDPQLKILCKRIKEYYKNTQPYFLKLCQDKNLNLTYEQLSSVINRVNKAFDSYHPSLDKSYLYRSQLYNNQAIEIYMQLIKQPKEVEFLNFSLIALPELINLKEEFLKAKEKNI